MTIQASDRVAISVPRTVLSDIVQLTPELTDRMHMLLERNTDGKLEPAELRELQTLVHMVEFAQIVSLALPPENR